MGDLHISTVLLPQLTLSSCALQLEKGRACLFCQLAILVFILPVMHSSLFTLSLTRSLSCPLVKLYLSGELSAACPLLRLLLFSSAYLLPSLVVATFQQLFCCHLLHLLQLPLCFLCCCLCCRRWSEPVGAALVRLGACARSGPTWSARNQVFATWQRCPVATILILDKAVLSAWQFRYMTSRYLVLGGVAQLLQY